MLGTMDLDHDRDQWRAYVRTVMNLCIPYKPLVVYDYYKRNSQLDVL